MLEYSKRSNPQISLLLMKLFGYMGATEYITDIYDGLFIKHLQTETLGYDVMCIVVYSKIMGVVM